MFYNPSLCIVTYLDTTLRLRFSHSLYTFLKKVRGRYERTNFTKSLASTVTFTYKCASSKKLKSQACLVVNSRSQVGVHPFFPGKSRPISIKAPALTTRSAARTSTHLYQTAFRISDSRVDKALCETCLQRSFLYRFSKVRKRIAKFMHSR